jgi:phosphoglycolate phosphatase
MKYQYIFWDWNGTLLNDSLLCIEILNIQLVQEGLPAISIDDYRRLFDFPLWDFYQTAGFDFSRTPFETIAARFMEVYNRRRFECDLQPHARETLAALSRAGLRQSVLSAYERTSLSEMVRHFGLSPYFERVIGPDNTHAEGKIGEGKRLLAEIGIPASQAVLIGDTVHDHDVAHAMGIHCILFAGGHHTKEKLATTGVPVFGRIDDIGAFILEAPK